MHWADLIATLRGIARDEVVTSQEVFIELGIIESYNPADGTCSVQLPRFSDENGQPSVLSEIPFGTPVAGPGSPSFGFRYYPPRNCPCIVILGREFVVATTFYNNAVIPPSDSASGDLAQGEIEMVGPPGKPGNLQAAVRWSADGKLRLNGQSSSPNYPVAVEGSTIEGNAALLTWIGQVQTALNNLTPGAITPLFPTTPGSEIGDVLEGQGAQSVLTVGPGSL